MEEGHRGMQLPGGGGGGECSRYTWQLRSAQSRALHKVHAASQPVHQPVLALHWVPINAPGPGETSFTSTAAGLVRIVNAGAPGSRTRSALATCSREVCKRMCMFVYGHLHGMNPRHCNTRNSCCIW